MEEQVNTKRVKIDDQFDQKDIGSNNNNWSEQSKIESETTIHVLNDYCVRHILSYLTEEDRLRAQYVSDQWHSIIIELTPKQKKLTIHSKGKLAWILRIHPEIEKINLNKFVGDIVFDLIGRYCPNIKTIKLSDGYMTSNQLIPFGQKYGQRLKKIKFKFSTTEKFQFNRIKRFLHYCVNLTKIW